MTAGAEAKVWLQVLAQVRFFSRLEPTELETVLAACEEVEFEAGATIFSAGDEGDALFIVASGRLEVWAGGEQGAKIRELGPGKMFGELSLILGEPRSATVQATENCRLLVLHRADVDRFFEAHPRARQHLEEFMRERRIQTVSGNPLCSYLDQGQLEELERLLEEEVFDRGDVVFSFGEEGDALYFVLSGELEVLSGEGEVIGHLGPPNSFGELALLRGEPRIATVRVASRARLLVLRREPFERFFAGNPKALEYFQDVRDNRNLQTLEQVPLFSYLNHDELGAALGLFEERTFGKGDVVCRAGEEGDAFYVVRSGELEVWGGEKGRELVGTIGPSGFFGEDSLILGEPRTATIRVSQEAHLLLLNREAFERFFLHNEKAVAYLAAVGRRRRTETIGRIPLFNLVSPEDLEQIQSEFLEETFRKGQAVCRAGDESTTFYIVLSGELEVWTGGESPRLLARLGRGDFFGELAVILGERRSATVVASQRTQLLGLPKPAFSKLFLNNPRTLEYFSRIICQRLASTVKEESVGEGTVQIAVSSEPGLRGKSLISGILARLLAEITDANVLLIRLQPASAPQPESGRVLYLSTFERRIDAVRSGFELPAPAPIELTLVIDTDSSSEQYGGALSNLVNRLRKDFRFQVFDLVSEPRAVAAAAGDFADVIVEIVENAEPHFAIAEGPEDANLVRYPVVNLFNPVSRRIPISACAPFVIPSEPGLSAESVLESRRSAPAVPLWRLARKLLRRSVGLALGGGAAFGLSHLGVLKVLEENDIPVDLLVGCSIGSMVAVSYAAGFRLEEMIEKAHEMGRSDYVTSGVDFTLSQPGIMAGDRLTARFTALLGECRTFNDLLIPCRTVATDIRSGELVTIGRGSLEDAYRASIAVPVVLSPKALDGRALVDGGVADPVPAETVRHMGADLCVAVSVVPPLKKGVETAISKWTARLNLVNPFAYLGSREMPNALDITMNALQTLQYELGLYKVISADVSIQPELSDFTWTDFGRSHELIEQGIQAAESALPDLRRMLRPGKE